MYLCFLGCHWIFSSLFHGLWPQCSYVQSSALPCCYVHKTLLLNRFGILFNWLQDSFVNVLCMSRLDFCDSSVIHHFFCDTSPILALPCTDIKDMEIMIFIAAGSTIMASLITIVVSYVSILSTILKITSTSGKQNAFSTCAFPPGSHHLLWH